MLGVGTGELLLILILAVLVVGPERMVKFAGDAGRWLAKMRQLTDGVTKDFKEALSLESLEGEEGAGEGAAATEEGAAASQEAASVATAEGQAAAEPAPQLTEGSAPPVGLRVPIVLDWESEPTDNGAFPKGGSAAEPVVIELAQLVPENDADVEPTVTGEVKIITDEPAPQEVTHVEG